MLTAIAGNIADLRKAFPDEQARIVYAGFLEDLLTGALPGVRVHRNGIRIAGAIVEGPLNLRNARISNEILFDQCRFKGTVTFFGAYIEQTLSFIHSIFEENTEFGQVEVKHDIDFADSIFKSQAGFLSAKIGDNFVAWGVHFANPNNGVYFDRMRVGGTALFSGAVF
jgi:hypothetical protein